MVTSKFTIGQQVRHRLLGFPGVIVDVDAEYSLSNSELEEMAINDSLRSLPWYHVVIEDEDGNPLHTYLAEAQLDHEIAEEHVENASLDDLSESIKRQLLAPRLRN